jgi:RNA polymerase sigma-70 factor (ECF subfamily)
VIRGAAAGEVSDKEAFARYYRPAIRSYLGARWRHSPLKAEIDDATQEVFLECFRGVLDRADETRKGGFRALLYGVTRNVARRFEERDRNRREVQPSSSGFAERVAANEPSLSVVFDRAWAESILDHAREAQARRAARQGADAQRRVDLLRLRFEEDTPIRAIAAQWEVEPQWLHNQYAKARKEFLQALTEVVRFHHPAPPPEVEAECARLLQFFE